MERNICGELLSTIDNGEGLEAWRGGAGHADAEVALRLGGRGRGSPPPSPLGRGAGGPTFDSHFAGRENIKALSTTKYDGYRLKGHRGLLENPLPGSDPPTP